MLSRTTARSARAVRIARAPQFRQGGRRFASTDASAPAATSGSSHAAIGAAAGAVGGILGAYLYGQYWYRKSGLKSISDTAESGKQYLQQAQAKLKEQAPEPNEALQWLRETALSYAGLVPFAKGYVNKAFDDIDKIHDKHGEEVDEIVRNAYNDLKQVGQKEWNLQRAQEAWSIIEKYMSQLGGLAGDAMGDILDNHPELKDKVGGNIDQLKQMADQYGPEAKKQVDETWNQVKEIVQSGWSADTVNKIRKLIDEKTEQVKKLGDEAWKKGMEQAKPYLDKNPQVKKLIEENADALKRGNAAELFNKAREAVESGNTEDIQSYIKSAADKAKQSGFGGLDQYLNKIPGGAQIMPKLSQLQDIAQKHGDEAQKLLKETMDEITQVLNKKSDQAQKLAEKASKDAKS